LTDEPKQRRRRVALLTLGPDDLPDLVHTTWFHDVTKEFDAIEPGVDVYNVEILAMNVLQGTPSYQRIETLDGAVELQPIDDSVAGPTFVLLIRYEVEL
jgi:hypothetical protein